MSLIFPSTSPPQTTAPPSLSGPWCWSTPLLGICRTSLSHYKVHIEPLSHCLGYVAAYGEGLEKCTEALELWHFHIRRKLNFLQRTHIGSSSTQVYIFQDVPVFFPTWNFRYFSWDQFFPPINVLYFTTTDQNPLIISFLSNNFKILPDVPLFYPSP